MKTLAAAAVWLCMVTLAGCGRNVAPSPQIPAALPERDVDQHAVLNDPAGADTSSSNAAIESETGDDDTVKPMADRVASDKALMPTSMSATTPTTTRKTTPADVDDSSHEPDLDPSTATAVVPPPDDRYRIWLPTSQGPLLIGLRVTINEEPLRIAFEGKCNAFHSEPTMTWDQVFAKVADDVATFGSNAAQITGQEKGLVKQYDRDQNGIADHDELVRFLFRESNVAGEFRLFGTDAFRYSNRTASPLLTAIDQNHDRQIDSDECLSAESTLLRQLDENADGCLDSSEIIAPTSMNDDPWQRSRFDRQGNIAMDLAGFVNWSNLSYAMGAMVNTNGSLSAFNPVVAIDTNEDQWISVDEAARIMQLEPAFTVVAEFSRSKPAALNVVLPADSTAISERRFRIEPGIHSQWIISDGFQIGLSAHDDPINQNRLPREIFVQLDADKNGGIDPAEFPDGAEQQFPFEELDTDQDGKLSFVEINQSITRSESIWNVQIRGRAAEHPDAFFAWLDRDHDQFLSSREIRAADSRLRSLMNGSDPIEFQEIPDTVLLQLGRGEPGQDNSRFQITRQRDPIPDDRPAWAIRMDANRDGDISETEFIGPIDSFRRYDSDEDHFLSVAEIYSIE